jgi:hypothetical protein
MPLDELLIAAAEAPPESRIEYRDRVAAYGDAAIKELLTPAWVGDSQYAGFAIQTIRRAGELGAGTALDALREASRIVTLEWHQNDIATALASLGVRPGGAKSSRKQPKSPPPSPIAPDDLVAGRCYKRSHLHDGGLGGNRQKGISYPASGTYCLLFSDPSKAHEYGYRDQPVGSTGYRYFGEWSGPGDMVMKGGNKAITDRSSELYLFNRASCGYVFRGRHRLVAVEEAKATRDGRQFNAIVFVLEASS